MSCFGLIVEILCLLLSLFDSMHNRYGFHPPGVELQFHVFAFEHIKASVVRFNYG